MSVAATQLARLSILQLEMPGNAPVSAGVLLEDPTNDRLYLRLRRDWDLIAPAEADVSHDDHFGLRVNDAVAQRGVPQSGIYD